MSPSTHEDIVCKSERISAKDKGKGKAIEVESESKNESSSEEESFEIEEEIADLNRLLKLTKDAKDLDAKLPYSQKEKNSYLNALRNDRHVQEFYDGEVPRINNLNELQNAL
jgi:hypothetical protein